MPQYTHQHFEFLLSYSLAPVFFVETLQPLFLTQYVAVLEVHRSQVL